MKIHLKNPALSLIHFCAYLNNDFIKLVEIHKIRIAVCWGCVKQDWKIALSNSISPLFIWTFLSTSSHYLLRETQNTKIWCLLKGFEWAFLKKNSRVLLTHLSLRKPLVPHQCMRWNISRPFQRWIFIHSCKPYV